MTPTQSSTIEVAATDTATSATTTPAEPKGPKPIISGRRGLPAQIAVYAFVLLPLIAVGVAVPFAWGWGLTWLDIILGVFFYFLTCMGVTVGFHRHFTHSSFKANRGLKVALTICGQMAVQGPVIIWVADHRRHHAFSDREGDPHSPWAFGTSVPAVAKGFWHSHMGWLFNRDNTNPERFAPDLLADKDVVAQDRIFWVWTIVSVVAPGILGALITWSWQGGLTALFWAGLVRIALLHHVTWSVNSICHMIGERPFSSRDRSANFWPLAILSAGESWHNLHHADPTCARHGVLRGQIDMSARAIWIFEKFGWATKVRWPNAQRLARIQATAGEMGH